MTAKEILNEFAQMDETSLMVALFYGEARMTEDTAMDEVKEYLAIGNVVLNRAKSNKFTANSVHEVILQKRQFSCFNEDDPNLKRMYNFVTLPDFKTDGLFSKMSVYAKAVLDGRTYDFSGGADHYVASWLYEDSKDTHWMYDMKITAVYGGHIFLVSKQ